MDKPSGMIHSHLYTIKKDTPLFTEFGGHTNPAHLLGAHQWVGVMDRKEQWYHVITVHCEGWIRVEDVEERSPFDLHVHWELGKPIEYVSAA